MWIRADPRLRGLELQLIPSRWAEGEWWRGDWTYINIHEKGDGHDAKESRLGWCELGGGVEGGAYEAALRSAWPEATGGAAKMRASGTPESKTPPDYTTAEIWEDIRNTAPGTSALEVVASRDPLGLYVQVAELAAQVRASASSPKAPQMLRLEAVLQDVRVFLRGRPRVAHRTTR